MFFAYVYGASLGKFCPFGFARFFYSTAQNLAILAPFFVDMQKTSLEPTAPTQSAVRDTYLNLLAGLDRLILTCQPKEREILLLRKAELVERAQLKGVSL